MGILLNVDMRWFIMGEKNSAPQPNPAMTMPEARPFLSGNHSSRAWMGGVYAQP